MGFEVEIAGKLLCLALRPVVRESRLTSLYVVCSVVGIPVLRL